MVAIGDEVIVKVTEIDEQGRINLSRRDALIQIEGLNPDDYNDGGNEGGGRPPRRNRDGGNRPRRHN